MLGPSSDGEGSGQENGTNWEASRSGSLMLVGHLRFGKLSHKKVNGNFAGYIGMVRSFVRLLEFRLLMGLSTALDSVWQGFRA